MQQIDIDDALHFDLPEEKERIRLLQMYYKEYLEKMKSIETYQDILEGLNQYGTLTEGMSGREIAKMMLYLQSIVYAQDEVQVSKALVDRVIKEKVEEHERKVALRTYREQ